MFLVLPPLCACPPTIPLLKRLSELSHRSSTPRTPERGIAARQAPKPVPTCHGALHDLLEPAEYLIGLVVGADESIVGF